VATKQGAVMKFIANYIAMTPAAKNTLVYEYFRTIWVDTVNEATKKAKQYIRKGYILSTVIQDEGKE
jgi:hypothetical protein